MRSILIASVCAAMIARTSLAWQAPSVSPGGPDQAALKVSMPEHVDVGVLGIGEWATHLREIQNYSNGSITLHVIRSSCPCVEVQLEPTIVPPGETGVVRIRAPVTAVAGRQTHYATIEANAVDDHGGLFQSARFDVAVSYQADLAFVIKPDKLWISTVNGAITERVVIVRSDVLDALNVRRFTINDEDLKVARVRRLPVPAPDRPGEEALVITLSGVFHTAGVRDRVLTFQTDDPDFASATIPIQIAVREFWLAVPAGFPIIIQENAAPIVQEVALWGRDGSACPVARVELREENGEPALRQGFSFSVIPGERNQVTRVRLVCDPSKIDPAEGILQLALFDRSGSLLRMLPVAWVRVQPSRP